MACTNPCTYDTRINPDNSLPLASLLKKSGRGEKNGGGVREKEEGLMSFAFIGTVAQQSMAINQSVCTEGLNS